MKAEYHSKVFQLIPDHLPKSFFILTGWNPFGQIGDHVDNQSVDKQIELEIGNLNHFRVIGMTPDEQHAEPGWGIACSEKHALVMARKYQQDAIYHVSGNSLTLISADGQKRTKLGSWKDRIRDPRNCIHFSIFVGSRNSAAITELDAGDRYGIIARVGAMFSSFTITDAEGYFRHNPENIRVIHVATDQPDRVLKVAHELRSFLDQEGVGILCRGIYQRVTAWSDDRMILRAWT